MRILGDRRSCVRFEIIGPLGGTLDILESVPLIDISQWGALVAASAALAEGQFHPVQVTLQGCRFAADARVRHVRCVSEPHAPAAFVMGLEFEAPFELPGMLS